MYYYEVWPRSAKYHAMAPLTYASEQRLAAGQLVRVPMARSMVSAFIVGGPVAKPKFTVKPIEAVLDLPPLPAALIKLGEWLLEYYPAPLGVVACQLLPELKASDEVDDFGTLDMAQVRQQLAALPALTPEQAAAAKVIKAADSYLLHGVTGSGKTRLYVELAAAALAAGRSSLILTPEISLTSQLAGRFREIFGGRVVVMHSRLTPPARRRLWQQILCAAEPLIIIGPRSILFAPLKSVGLIVLDEAHEPAYKHEQAPHYQAARVAAKLRQLTDSTLVLGSATPRLEDYFLAEQRGKPILSLTRPALGVAEPVVPEIIDLKDRSQFGSSVYLSLALERAVRAALGANEQSLLYLNRRGTARLVICEHCGWQAVCPRCDLPLTYHGDQHQLRCHVCGYSQKPPVSCPDCGQAAVVYKSIGTKAVLEEVKRLFPTARVSRFDTDNSKAESMENQYDMVRRGDVDILVGTQLLAKGLDLPRLSVVGVLLADTSLQIPDFTASERTYQLIHQVVGRVGRGHGAGRARAIIQTYQPANPAITAAAAAGGWPAFYKRELQERQQFKYPPFYHLLKVTVRRATAKSAETAASKLAENLRGTDPSLIIEGPAPSLHEKVAGKYQQQLVIKAKKRSQLTAAIRHLPATASYDIDPVDLL